MIVVEDIENLNTINKRVPIAGNSNFTENEKRRGSKGIMINLQAQG